MQPQTFVGKTGGPGAGDGLELAADALLEELLLEDSFSAPAEERFPEDELSEEELDELCVEELSVEESFEEDRVERYVWFSDDAFASAGPKNQPFDKSLDKPFDRSLIVDLTEGCVLLPKVAFTAAGLDTAMDDPLNSAGLKTLGLDRAVEKFVER